MRAARLPLVAILLAASTQLAGCSFLVGGDSNEDCGTLTTAKAPLDPTQSISTTEYDAAKGKRTYYVYFSPSPDACAGQHATWTSVTNVRPASSAPCPAFDMDVSVSVKAQAGIMGNIHPTTATETAGGGADHRAGGTLGTGQSDQPVFLALTNIITMAGSDDAQLDAECFKGRIPQVVMTIDYKPSKAASGGR